MVGGGAGGLLFFGIGEVGGGGRCVAFHVEKRDEVVGLSGTGTDVLGGHVLEVGQVITFDLWSPLPALLCAIGPPNTKTKKHRVGIY